MAQPIRIFFTGMCISFLGTLPLGVLNISAARLAVETGLLPAFAFSTGALLVEMSYVRLSLVAMDRVRRYRRLWLGLEWLTVAIVGALGIGSIFTNNALGGHSFIASPMGSTAFAGVIVCFLTGSFLSAINPLQIPFWFGWSTVLISRGSLLPTRGNYNSYTAGIGTGTFMANAMFIFAGHYFIKAIAGNMRVLNITIGVVFFCTAILQAYKIICRKEASLAYPLPNDPCHPD